MLNCDKSILVCKVGIGDIPKHKAMELACQVKIQLEKSFKMDEHPEDDSLVLIVIPDRASNSIDIQLLNARYPDVDEIKKILEESKQEIENLYK